MAEYKTPTTEQEYNANFAQLKPLMNETEAHFESSRCLFCYDAPCVNACPSGIDIPLFIRQINSGNVSGAAKTIYDSNYFGYACGKVCPTEVLCEGACVYNEQNVKPIEIGSLQSVATGHVIQKEEMLYKMGEATGKKVAVIGAGPAGLGAACELRLRGHEVDVYEAKSHPSGLTVYGVAPYKITNGEALDEMAYLQKQFGYNVKYDHPISSADDLANLEANYDAIFLGIGLGATRTIHIQGEELENCFGAVEFIEDLRMDQEKVSVSERVVVIGGGNTAMDAASESARMGAEQVYLAYRRDKEGMSAYEFEYDLAKGVGVKGLWNVQPVAILGDKAVSGVRFIRTRIEDGKVHNIEGSEFEIACDMVIRATGQSKQVDWLAQISGLETDRGGRIVV
ncbi:MAG: FAD-dependent oxidoreductase, partial [Bacteroidota bacterium]